MKGARLVAFAAVAVAAVFAACAGQKPPPPAPPAAPTPEPPPAIPTAVPAPEPRPAPPVPPPTGFLNGTVTYTQRMALTPQAEVQVELRDVSAQDAASTSTLIAKQLIATPGQVPIPFSLEYDATKIRGGRTYAISARIVDRGQLQFITEARIPVLTGAAQGPIEIVVVPVR
jgi:putative lipoprotein